MKTPDFRPAIRRALKSECKADLLAIMTPWPKLSSTNAIREQEEKLLAWMRRQPSSLTTRQLYKAAQDAGLHSHKSMMTHSGPFARLAASRPQPQKQN